MSVDLQPDHLLSPILKPGIRVFRRDDQHLQLGLDRDQVVLKASPGVRRLIDDLIHGRSPSTQPIDAAAAFLELSTRGLLIERHELKAALGRGTHRPAVVSAFAAHGIVAPDRLRQRGSFAVAIRAPGDAPIHPWYVDLSALIVESGLKVERRPERAGVVLALQLGEPPRSRFDELMRADQPHLVVTVLPDRVRVGPFVAPGLTACMRCVDAHLAEDDPRRPLLMLQLEEKGPTDDSGEAWDPGLVRSGFGMAIRDLVSFADGELPSTWSTTIEVERHFEFSRRRWSRHPHCGCCWG